MAATSAARRPCDARRGRTAIWRPARPPPALADSPYTQFLQISVTDNGIGISADGMQRLFRPFSQIDSGLARKFEGTGLGLAMVKLLAELHCGAVAVESAVGEGSCFTVWLPVRELEHESAAATAIDARRQTGLTRARGRRS